MNLKVTIKVTGVERIGRERKARAHEEIVLTNKKMVLIAPESNSPIFP